MKLSTLSLCLIVGAAIVGITSAQNVVEVEEDRYLSLVDDTSMSMSMPKPIAEEVVVEEETTPWKVKPKPFPSNYRLLTSMDPSDEDTIYGYTFAVAGEDASLTSHTVSGVSDEDSTLYFKLQEMGTCFEILKRPSKFHGLTYLIMMVMMLPRRTFFQQLFKRRFVGRLQLNITLTKVFRVIIV